MKQETGCSRRSLAWAAFAIFFSAVFFQGPFVQAQQADNGPRARDPFILGPSTPIRTYTSAEAVNWTRDFILSPTEARDRVVLYAYDVGDVDQAFFKKIQKQILEQNPKIAVVSSLSDGKIRFSGKEVGFIGVPIILDVHNEPVVRTFIDTLDSLESYKRVVPAIMALSALKTSGIDPEHFKRDWKDLTQGTQWSGKIATSIKVEGNDKFGVYVASATAWDSKQNPPQTMAKLSEVAKISYRY